MCRKIGPAFWGTLACTIRKSSLPPVVVEHGLNLTNSLAFIVAMRAWHFIVAIVHFALAIAPSTILRYLSALVANVRAVLSAWCA
jgi:hypothetical protein